MASVVKGLISALGMAGYYGYHAVITVDLGGVQRVRGICRSLQDVNRGSGRPRV